MLTIFIGWLLTYKYIILFPVAFIEGPIITIIAGSLAATGQLNLTAAYIVIVVGDVAADSMYYALGRYGRDKVINRWGHYIGLTPDRLQLVDRHYLDHAAKTLIVGKLAFSFEIPVIVSAGIARFSYVRFVLYMIFGALPKTLALLLIGYFFGYSFVTAHRGLSYAARASVAIAVVLCAVTITHLVLKRFSRVYASRGIIGLLGLDDNAHK